MKTSTTTAQTSEVCETSEVSGRDTDGRFAKGNKGGPGNPFAREVAEMRKAFTKRLTPERAEKIADRLIDLAEEGNIPAAKLVLSYTLGKPGPMTDPDKMDIEDILHQKQEMELLSLLKELVQCPALWMMLEVTRVSREAATLNTATMFKDTLKDMDKKDRKKEKQRQKRQQQKEERQRQKAQAPSQEPQRSTSVLACAGPDAQAGRLGHGTAHAQAGRLGHGTAHAQAGRLGHGTARSAKRAAAKLEQALSDEWFERELARRTEEALGSAAHVSLLNAAPSTNGHESHRAPSTNGHESHRAPSTNGHEFHRAPSTNGHEFHRAPSTNGHESHRAPSTNGLLTPQEPSTNGLLTDEQVRLLWARITNPDPDPEGEKPRP